MTWWLANNTIPASTDYTIYDPIGASDLASSYENKANPGTRDALPGVAPTHTQGEGWTFNGTTQYLNTQTLGATTQTVVMWVENASGVYQIGYFNNAGGLDRQHMRFENGADAALVKGDSFSPNETVNGILGWTETNYYKNGENIGSVTNYNPTTSPLNFYIGAWNQNGSAGNFGSGKIARVAIYNISLSDAQMRALALTMFDYNQPANDSYSTTVLGLNPVAYYTHNQSYGNIHFDISGNNAHAETITGQFDIGETGLKGNAVGSQSYSENIRPNAPIDFNTRTGLNLDNYSFSCWYYFTPNDIDQIRINNCRTNSNAEYSTIEIRDRDKIGLFHREAEGDHIISNWVTSPTDEWVHFVFYNNLAGGKIGIYVNGVKTEVDKTTTGFTDGIPDNYYPNWWFEVDGLIQHVAWFDYVLSDEQVQTLYLDPTTEAIKIIKPVGVNGRGTSTRLNR